jgi:hypothetical protein
MIEPELLAQLDEDELRFVPREGAFDTEQIAKHLASVGYSFRDEADPEMIVIASTPEVRNILQERRRKAPDGGFSYFLLVQLTSQEITVFPAADGDYAELSASVIRWLLTTYPCRVFNDNETEVTGALAGARPT